MLCVCVLCLCVCVLCLCVCVLYMAVNQVCDQYVREVLQTMEAAVLWISENTLRDEIHYRGE